MARSEICYAHSFRSHVGVNHRLSYHSITADMNCGIGQMTSDSLPRIGMRGNSCHPTCRYLHLITKHPLAWEYHYCCGDHSHRPCIAHASTTHDESHEVGWTHGRRHAMSTTTQDMSRNALLGYRLSLCNIRR